MSKTDKLLRYYHTLLNIYEQPIITIFVVCLNCLNVKICKI